MRLLLDENLSMRQFNVLNELGFDVDTVKNVGLLGRPDLEIRQFAIFTQRIIVTLDGDFADVIKNPPTGTPGIIRLKIYPPTEDRIEYLIRKWFLSLRTIEEITGHIYILEENKIRMRG